MQQKIRTHNGMLTIRNIKIKSEDNYLSTINLKRFVGFELKLLIREKHYDQYIKVVNYLINYFLDYTPVINNDQTIAYHSWLLKFVIVNNVINLYEVQSNGDGFIEGVDYAIKVVAEQKEECTKHNTNTLFPLFSQMIVVSKGVLEGRTIDAVRYPSPSHMTGWWLTTELYNNEISSLETIHYYHLAFKRLDIIKYLALPFGYRFLAGEQKEVWFDNNILS
jgi:hypothetical protein